MSSRAFPPCDTAMLPSPISCCLLVLWRVISVSEPLVCCGHPHWHAADTPAAASLAASCLLPPCTSISGSISLCLSLFSFFFFLSLSRCFPHFSWLWCSTCRVFTSFSKCQVFTSFSLAPGRRMKDEGSSVEESRQRKVKAGDE